MENIKKQIENILEELKALGFNRRAVEKELNKSENYIDQILSRGGNNKFLNELKRLKKSITESTGNIYNAVKENKLLIDLLVLEVIKLRSKVFEIPMRTAEEQFRQDVDLALTELEKKE